MSTRGRDGTKYKDTGLGRGGHGARPGHGRRDTPCSNQKGERAYWDVTGLWTAERGTHQVVRGFVCDVCVCKKCNVKPYSLGTFFTVFTVLYTVLRNVSHVHLNGSLQYGFTVLCQRSRETLTTAFYPRHRRAQSRARIGCVLWCSLGLYTNQKLLHHK